MSNRTRDLVRDVDVRSRKVDVISYQRRTRSNCGDSGGRMNACFAEVRQARFLAAYLIANAFKLSLSHRRQILALGPGSRFLVEVDRNAKLAPHSLTASACERDAFVHRNAADRHKRNHVDRAHARMLTGMLVEIDELGCFSGSGNGGIDYFIG